MLNHLKHWLLEHCDAYRTHPDRFAVADADALYGRYRHIGLVDTSAMRPETFFPEHCGRMAVARIGAAAEARIAPRRAGCGVPGVRRARGAAGRCR